MRAYSKHKHAAQLIYCKQPDVLGKYKRSQTIFTSVFHLILRKTILCVMIKL